MKLRPFLRGLLLALLAPLLSVSCSLTEKVPAGEQLYTGIRDVNYTLDTPLSKQRNTATADSAGVITSIANVARRTAPTTLGFADFCSTRTTVDTRKERTHQYRQYEDRNRRRARLSAERCTLWFHEIHHPVEVRSLDIQSFCRLQKRIG